MHYCVTIHQPQYLAWSPYFAKILASDCFVFLDQVAFQKNGVQNRNQIKTASGKTWLTVPVKQDFGQLIKDTEIANPIILKKHIKALEINYQKSPFFLEVSAWLFPILSQPFTNLSMLNIELTRAILQFLNFSGKIYLASELDVSGTSSELIRNICVNLKASHYLSGQGGRNYMDLEDFKSNNIEVVFHEFSMKSYLQLFSNQPFFNDLSIIDLLFNVGPLAADYLL